MKEEIPSRRGSGAVYPRLREIPNLKHQILNNIKIQKSK